MPVVLHGRCRRCDNTPASPHSHSDEGCPLSSDIPLHYQVGSELCHRQKSGKLPAIKQREHASIFRTEPLPHHPADCPVMCSGWALTPQRLPDVTLLLTCPRHWPSSPDALGRALLCPQNLLYTGDFSGSPSVTTQREVLRVAGFK